MTPLPLVLSLPHAAWEIPPEMADELALSPEQVAESVDHGAAEVLAPLPFLAQVRAKYSRLAVDPNRAPDEDHAKGVIARTDYHGREIFRPGQYPGPQARGQRVAAWHRPFHLALEEALAQPGVRGLIDGHSLDGIGPADAPDAGQRRADVCLGNLGGAQGRGEGVTCPPGLFMALARALEDQGLSVSLNHPYRGGYIVQHYGALLMARGAFALQMELNKDLYLDLGGRVEPSRAAQASARVGTALAGVTAG